ncbi:MAG TPA: LamG domain-containing protein [Candidatus Paceibacterota bacterium]
MPYNNRQSFTLLELLIVIGILGILGIIVVLVLNPAALFSQARDANRISEILSINKAIKIYQTLGGTTGGVSDTVYISIPSNSATCVGLNLPTLPAGWSYQCQTQDNFRKMNGTGWIPINFTTISAGSPFATLPIDPINDATKNLYYAYIDGGGVVPSYEILATLESEKYLQDSSSKDGGTDPTKYEEGTNLILWAEASGLLGYWPFDGNAQDSSGNGYHGSIIDVGPPSPTFITGQINQGLNLPGIFSRVDAGQSLPILGLTKATASFWIKFNTLPSIAGNPFALMGRWTGNDASRVFGIFIRDPNTTAMATDNPTQKISYLAIPTLQTGQWYHFAYTYNAGNGNFYIDGENIGAFSGLDASLRISAPSSSFTIGADSEPYGPSNATFDDARFYNRLMTDQEIQSIYLSGK